MRALFNTLWYSFKHTAFNNLGIYLKFRICPFQTKRHWRLKFDKIKELEEVCRLRCMATYSDIFEATSVNNP